MECDMSYVDRLLVVAVSMGSEHGTDRYRTKRIQIVMIQCHMGPIFYRLCWAQVFRELLPDFHLSFISFNSLSILNFST